MRDYLSPRLVAEWLFRWIPVSTEPGLMVFGRPSRSSPVFLTCNYDLTVRRVKRYLRGLDCYLLVAPTKGINVWCASCGGDFNEHSVISVIRSTGIDGRVDHRVLIAPQLSAPGIDTKRVKDETGWTIEFGPVYAASIPAFVEKCSKTPEMRVVRFDLCQRLEMATIYFVTIALVMIIPLILFLSRHLAAIIGFTSLMVYGMYGFFPLLPFRSGFFNTALCETTAAGIVFYASYVTTGNPLGMAYLLATSLLVASIVGLDFNGTSPIYKSDLGDLLYRRGGTKMRFFTGTYPLGRYGEIRIQSERCIGCKICLDVCPKAVYTFDDQSNKAQIEKPWECVNCGACVKQCPAGCLEIA